MRAAILEQSTNGVPMDTHELRAEARIPVTQRGNLSAGDAAWFPCMVLDMSSSGFLMVSNTHFEVGQILEFRCELYPEKSLNCMIEVMHSNEDSAGTMITEIDEKAKSLLQVYLEEKYAVKLDKPPKAREREEQ
jgi:hypothetical protein